MRFTDFAYLAVALGLLACSGTPPPVEPVEPPPPEAKKPAPLPAVEAGPPEARRQDVVDQVHGVAVADPYRWLEDIAQKEVVAWADGQDDYARKQLAKVPQRAALVERFTELYYTETMNPPGKRGGRYFYSRRHKDKEKSVVYWREGENGAEKVLFDPNTWSDDGSISLSDYVVSWDGKKVAYKKSSNNADEGILYVHDIDTGKDSPIDVIPDAMYADASWTPDNKGFYYEWLPPASAVDASDRPGYTEVRFHRLGTDPKEDEIVFPAMRDPKVSLGGGVTRDGRWLMVYLGLGWSSTDVYVRDLRSRRKPKIPPKKSQETIDAMSTRERADYYAGQYGLKPMVVGQDAIFHAYWWKGYFYVHTNYQAPKYRVMKVRARDVGNMKKWKELIPEGDSKLDRIHLIGGKMVVRYLRNASSEVEVRSLKGKLLRKFELPAIGTVHNVRGNPDDDEAFFSFSSFTQPKQVYKTSIKSGATETWFKNELPVDTSKMAVEQVWYPSRDGTKVSMFIIHRKDLEKNGQNPTVLYGYGGFNISMTPKYRSSIAVWLEQGGIWAIANLRGGGEYGESWHRAGMLENKQNVFDDFIAAAEFLAKEKYTSPDRLAIYGGSNGGLLVGAAMTQRPELFRAVVCAVPLLDMVRYHMFGGGKTWIPEYGSAENPEQFKYIHAYSPYHQVQKGTAYPSMLMMAADSDDRVDPLHARKFTAAVQWATSSEDRPVLMRVERNAGHGGADVAAKSVQRTADMFAYLLSQLGR